MYRKRCWLGRGNWLGNILLGRLWGIWLRKVSRSILMGWVLIRLLLLSLLLIWLLLWWFMLFSLQLLWLLLVEMLLLFWIWSQLLLLLLFAAGQFAALQLIAAILLVGVEFAEPDPYFSIWGGWDYLTGVVLVVL